MKQAHVFPDGQLLEGTPWRVASIRGKNRELFSAKALGKEQERKNRA